jgi:hypothetical protein
MTLAVVFRIELVSTSFCFKFTQLSWWKKEYISLFQMFNFNFFSYIYSTSRITFFATLLRLFTFATTYLSSSASFVSIVEFTHFLIEILAPAPASSFLIHFSLPIMYLLRRSVKNFIVFFREHVTLRHIFFSIIHRLISLFLELTHIRSCQSRILPKPFIKLFLVITSKVYNIQLFFGEVVKPFV